MTKFENFTEALKTIGISAVVDGFARPMDAVMEDLRGKWNDLTAKQQQDVANAFTAYMINN